MSHSRSPSSSPSWYDHYQASMHPSIEFRNGIYGYSGYATDDIPQDGRTELLSLPYSSILNEDYSIRTSGIGRLIWQELRLQEKYPKEVTPRMIMYLVMIYERSYNKEEDEKDEKAKNGEEFTKTTTTMTTTPSPRFGPYLRSLPIHYDDPTVWSREELSSLLRGTNLYYGALHRIEWLHRIYQVFFPYLSDRYPTIFKPTLFTYEAFAWAHCAFSSRGFPDILSKPPSKEPSFSTTTTTTTDHHSESFPSASASSSTVSSTNDVIIDPLTNPDINPFQTNPTEPIGCMLPVLDILNHAPHTPVQWIRYPDRVSFIAGHPDNDTNNKHWATSITTTTTTTTTTVASASSLSSATSVPTVIPQGTEIFNNYGPKSNEELLLAFGFVLPDNEFDTLSLVLGSSNASSSSSSSSSSTAISSESGNETTKNDNILPPVTFWSEILQLSRRFTCRRLRRTTGTIHGKFPSVAMLEECLPPALLQYLRTITLDPEEHKYLYHLYRTHPSLFTSSILPTLFTQPLSVLHEERTLVMLRELVSGKLDALMQHHPWLRPLKRANRANHLSDDHLERIATENYLDSVERSSNSSSANCSDDGNVESTVNRRNEMGPGMITGASSEYVTENQRLDLYGTVMTTIPTTNTVLTDTTLSSSSSPSYRYRRYMARMYIRGQYDILKDMLDTINNRLQRGVGYEEEEVVTDTSTLSSASSSFSSLYQWLTDIFNGTLDTFITSHSIYEQILTDIVPRIQTTLVVKKEEESEEEENTMMMKKTSGVVPSLYIPYPLPSSSSSIVYRIPLSFCLYPFCGIPEFSFLRERCLGSLGLKKPSSLSFNVPRNSGSSGANEQGKEEEEDDDGNMDEYGEDNGTMDGPSLHVQFLCLVIFILQIRRGLPPYDPDYRSRTADSTKKRKRDTDESQPTVITAAKLLPPSSTSSSESSSSSSSAFGNGRSPEFLYWTAIVERYMWYDTSTIQSWIPVSVEYSTDLYTQLYKEIMVPLSIEYSSVFPKEYITKSLWLWACSFVQFCGIPLKIPIMIPEPSVLTGCTQTPVFTTQLVIVPLYPFVPYAPVRTNTEKDNDEMRYPPSSSSLSTMPTTKELPIPTLTAVRQTLNRMYRNQQPYSRWGIEQRNTNIPPPSPPTTIITAEPLSTAISAIHERYETLPYDVTLDGRYNHEYCRNNPNMTVFTGTTIIPSSGTSVTKSVNSVTTPSSSSSSSTSSTYYEPVTINITDPCVPTFGFTIESTHNEWIEHCSNLGLGKFLDEEE